jgi:hypothetical protein
LSSAALQILAISGKSSSRKISVLNLTPERLFRFSVISHSETTSRTSSAPGLRALEEPYFYSVMPVPSIMSLLQRAIVPH